MTPRERPWQELDRLQKARQARLLRKGRGRMHVDGESHKIYATLLIGRKVRRGRSVREIVAVYRDIVGGVWLDRDVDGCRSWNLDALRGVGCRINRRYWERNWIERGA